MDSQATARENVDYSIENTLIKQSKLPHIPAVITRIIDLSSKETITAARLASEIQRDPLLVSRILKITNSSYYSLSKEVTTLSSAVAILGISTIQSIVMSAAILNTLYEKDTSLHLHLDHFWQYSFFSAVSCQLLAKEKKYSVPEEAFIVGLLHNIGDLVFLKSEPEVYQDIFEKKKEGFSALKLEKASFDTDHARVGYAFSKKGNLPAFMQEAILHHHYPPSYKGKCIKTRRMTVFIYLADTMTDVFMSTEKANAILKFKAMARKWGGIDEEHSEYILNKVGDEIEKSKEIFDELSFCVKNYEDILQEANYQLGKITLDFHKINRKLKARELELVKLNNELLIENKERKMAEEKIKSLAYYDSLTGLANRLMINKQLTREICRAERSNEKIAVLFIDLDHFKNINDTLGHDVGDMLLKEVAARLCSSMRKHDSIGRLGGDEFIVLQTQLRSPDNVITLSQRIISLLKSPFELASNSLYVTPSVGIAVYPENGTDEQTLIKNADTAMYSAKERGGSTYALFDSSMNDKLVKSMEMKARLCRTLKSDGFILEYQPLFDLKTNKVLSVEALLRWYDPSSGSLSPVSFSSIAEDTGLILSLEKWVLEAACWQNKKWQSLGYSPVRMAVKVSAKQILKQDFNELVFGTLKDTELDAKWLELEIDESVLAGDTISNVDLLSGISDAGVRITLDGFGVGVSSLGCIRMLPITSIKVDPLVISNILESEYESTVTSAVISMAHTLDVEVIADGVETESQVKLLQRMGCDIVQGGFYANPMLPEKAAKAFFSKA